MTNCTSHIAWWGRRKVVSVAAAVAVAASLAPLFASPAQAYAESLSADGQVLGAAYAAAEPAPDILGLDNPEERTDATASDMKLAIFGTDINENPDPFFYNTYQVLTGTDTSASPTIITDKRQGGPMAAKLPYANDGSASDQVWDLLPDVIIGTGADAIPSNESTFYLTDQYARAVETANGLASGSYNPIGVTYNRTDLNTMIATMYRIAEAGDKAADANGKTLRYGDALDIAKDYERYITGSKGAVLKAINNGTVPERTIASVQSYDATSDTYKIITGGNAEGTATTNRLLEAVQGVTTNYYDVSTAAVNDDNTKTVTAAELANCDVIIVGGQNQSGDPVEGLTKDGLIGKTFYASSMSTGSIFGTTVNSVENAQNVGRVLSCVYPEVLNQADMIAYYYDTFYHIKDGDLASTIDTYMDGVRNWANTDASSYTVWDADDVANYNHDEVENILQGGIDYLNMLTTAGVSYDSIMQPTSYLSATVYADSQFTDVTSSTPHLEDITWLAANGITTGYADGTFQGMTSVYRQDMAAFLYREAKLLGIGDAATWEPSESDFVFTDVTTDTPHYKEILWLAHAGIAQGYANGDGTYSFGGMTTVYRQDMAAFLHRMATLGGFADKVTPSTAYANDASVTSHQDDVAWLAGAQITTGYEDGTFQGMWPTYRQDMAAFLHRLANLDA